MDTHRIDKPDQHSVLLRFDPSAYPPHQLKAALLLTAYLGRGPLFLLEDPEDG